MSILERQRKRERERQENVERERYTDIRTKINPNTIGERGVNLTLQRKILRKKVPVFAQ